MRSEQEIRAWESQVITDIHNRSGFAQVGSSQRFTAFSESNKTFKESLGKEIGDPVAFAHWRFVDTHGEVITALTLLYQPMGLCLMKHFVQLGMYGKEPIINEYVLKQVFLLKPEPNPRKNIYVFSDNPNGGDFEDVDQIALVLQHLVTSGTKHITVTDDALLRKLNSEIPKWANSRIALKPRDKLRPLDMVEAEKYGPNPIDTVLMLTHNERHEQHVRDVLDPVRVDLIAHGL